MLTELETAYEAAIQQQAKSRNKEITKFDREVSQSILDAGLQAIKDSSSGVAVYRVVSAPTGSGKSSYAQALIKAYIEVFPEASVLFLVETIQQAEATYGDMSSLVGKETVAVWTSAHDPRVSAEAIQQEHGFVPEQRFSVDDLANYPVVIATHRFYMGPRARKATFYKGQG
jgi:Type III restriction enzyme, res subunit